MKLLLAAGRSPSRLYRSQEVTHARMVVIYKTPKDLAAFDRHYFGIHVPLAKTPPGLRKYEVSRGPVATPAGLSDFYLVATPGFDDMDALKAAFVNPLASIRHL